MAKRCSNKDAYNAYQRQWRSKNSNHCSQWEKDRYATNERVREQKIKAAKKWHRNNLERSRENNRRYYLANYERFAAANLARHSRQPMDKELVLQIFEEDNYTCVYCSVRGGKLTIDHKIPVSCGGTNDRNNLCTACHRCNCSKGAKTVQEFEQYMLEVLYSACVL